MQKWTDKHEEISLTKENDIIIFNSIGNKPVELDEEQQEELLAALQEMINKR